ncbi:uncharacterized protein LOC136096687 [Hydra vulgaris]|uniref:uncharacterized protein LOC136096687 n=1 Tax=Hydra vulgaris TaxID=6087 RepID=UPI0032E9DCB4
MNLAKNNVIKILNSNKGSKINIDLLCEMESTDIITGETIKSIPIFKSLSEVVLESTDLNDFYERAKEKILESMATFQRTKSNWSFVSVVEMNINIIEYKSIKGKSYIPLPKELAAKKAIINMKNEDNECFKWLRIELPKPNTMIEFKNYNKSMRVPFVIYADFESFIKPIDTCTPNPDESYTKQYQKLTPSSFCYYIKCFDESIEKTIEETIDHSILATFTADSEDDDVAQIFVDNLEADIKKIYNKYLKFPKDIIFTSKDKEEFKNAKACHICEKDLEEDKVKDHCHITGKYRGAAHNECNLNYKIPNFIPVFFHNLSGYDSHLFIKKLSGNGESEEKINCIPNNEEKYISFSEQIKVDEYINKKGKKVEIKKELRFLDSYKFMASSLYELIKNSTKDLDLCSNKKLNLLLRKGVYPYEWVDSISKLNETQLPPKESIFSRLNDEEISDEGYLHAQTVWKEFNCETFRDYHNLYNVADVLLLAHVFENFRDVCIKNFKLDPAWYYTSPGLAWDAALLITKVKLELLSDYDMILMIKQGIRGGISMVPNRIGTANNKYIENYDESKESTYIQYLDANNLYGWAMSKPLPTHGFEWMSEEELKNWKSTSCILEVDLEYPEHLHDLRNDYPLAPERLKIDRVEKLVTNLRLKITKIHRGVKFEESPWLSKYIDLNTNLRTKATNDFEKDFFKLMNNSVFGKTMENIENRVDVRLVAKKEAKKLASKPNYESRTTFDENLIVIHMKRTKLIYNKPIYLIMCILDLSKTLMYEFHYDYIKSKYEDRAKLLYTDTDSLIYEIKTKDFYADITNDIESKFDTREFDKNHPAVRNGFKVGVNKKVLEMFKDESAGKQISEFLGLRSKLYSYKVDEEDKKRCKGVNKNVVKNYITHEDYKDCLMNRKDQMRKMNIIRSHCHDVYTEEINEIALSAEDDKRVILKDGIYTLAYGHYKLKDKPNFSFQIDWK